MATKLTAEQRAAAIKELQAAAVTYLSGAAAGRIVDRVCSDQSPFGNLLRGAPTQTLGGFLRGL